jgi:hypothetical protein
VLLLRNIGVRSRSSVGYALRHGGKDHHNSMGWRPAGFQNRNWLLLRRVSNRNDGFIVDGVESSGFSACEFIKGELRSFSSVTHTKLYTVLVFILQSESDRTVFFCTSLRPQGKAQCLHLTFV